MLPTILMTKQKPTDAMMRWAQDVADRAYRTHRMSNYGFETEAPEICAAKGAVKPHVDNDGPVAGKRAVGLVLRSDGHRLHSDRLQTAGITGGLALAPGTLYTIDPLDRHWTSVPEGSVDPQLIFSVYIMDDDGRTPSKLAHDIWWSVLAASIDAYRP